MKSIYLLFSISFYGLFTNVSFSQSLRLFNYITVAENTLTGEQLTRLNKIDNDTNYTAWYFIEFNDIERDSNYSGQLYTPLPDSTSLNFKFHYVSDKDNSFVWYGEFSEIEDSVLTYRNLLYINDEDGKYGLFSTQSESYEIFDLSDDLQVLAILDTMDNHSICYSIDSLDSFSYPQNDNIESRVLYPCKIRVYFTFTEDAADEVPSISQKAKKDIELANAVLRNSDISPEKVEFQYIGREQLNEFEFTYTDVKTDKDEMIQSGVDGEIKDIRDNYHADIIVVYVPTDWVLDGTFFVHGVAGKTGVVENNEGIEKSVVGINVDVPSKKRVFAHEAGHIIGADHESEEEQPTTSNHAFRFSVYIPWHIPAKKKFKTSMYSTSDQPHFYIYSNPNVYLAGDENYPLGTAYANNALKISDQGCPTAQLFESQEDDILTISISGPIAVINGTTEDFTANVYYGEGPFSYDWYLSYDGINYQHLNDNDDEVTIHLTGQLGAYLMLKCEVEDNQNVIAESFHPIQITEDGHVGFQNSPSGSIISVSPNPIQDGELEVNFEIIEDDLKDISLGIIRENGAFSSINNFGILNPGKYTRRIKLSEEVTSIQYLILSTNSKILDMHPFMRINKK